MPWDPDQYERFREERLQPGRDLIAMIEAGDGLSVIDLGCGTGRLTRELADRLPHADVLGIDRSEEMLAEARQHARDAVRFERRAIEDIEGTYDRIYSNAALHWLPDHPALLKQLMSHLAPGGQLAFQVPSNSRHPITRIRHEVMRSEPFADALANRPSDYGVLDLHEYAHVLFDLGAEAIQVREVVYPHVIEDADAIAEWQKGTALVPIREALGNESFDAFLDAFRERLRAEWPGSPVLFPFRRTFVSARAPI